MTSSLISVSGLTDPWMIHASIWNSLWQRQLQEEVAHSGVRFVLGWQKRVLAQHIMCNDGRLTILPQSLTGALLHEPHPKIFSAWSTHQSFRPSTWPMILCLTSLLSCQAVFSKDLHIVFNLLGLIQSFLMCERILLWYDPF